MATAATRATSPGERARSWAPPGIRDTEVAIALGGAMALAAALVLWFGRDTTFSQDELVWFSTSPHLDLHGALEPYNGHLILVTRLVYAGMLNAFGPGYVGFRLLTLGTLLLTAGLFFVYARRRVGGVIALAPTLILLVYGSDAGHVLSGNGFTVLLAVSCGLGALLALEREDLAGDVVACLLLLLGVATYSVGLAFVAAVAVCLLISEGRWRRAWVWLAPALLYGAWLLWSHNAGSSTTSSIDLWNLLLVPKWALDSLASVGGAFLGLSHPSFDVDWGPLVALALLAGLGWRLWRGDASKWLWTALAVAAALWTIEAARGALPPWRAPSSSRYIFPGTIAVLLVVAEASRGMQLGRRGVLLLYAVVAIGLMTNISLLRSNSTNMRLQAAFQRTDLATVEIAGGRFGPRLATGSSAASAPESGDLASSLGGQSVDAQVGAVLVSTGQGNVATGYMEAVHEFGSPAFSLPELRAQPDLFRDHADVILADNLGLRLQPSSSPARSCQPVAGKAFELPRGGAVLIAKGTGGALTLRRFGSAFTVQAGTLPPNTPMTLAVPTDSAPDPWYASTPAARVSLCGLHD